MVVKQIQHQLNTGIGFQTSWFLANNIGAVVKGYGELGVAKRSPSWNSIAAQGSINPTPPFAHKSPSIRTNKNTSKHPYSSPRFASKAIENSR